MSQSQAFGDYQKRKYIRSPKKSYYSPKGKNKLDFNKSPAKTKGNTDDFNQQTLLKYYSPSSESKKRKISPVSAVPNYKTLKKNSIKKNLFLSETEDNVICLSDDDDKQIISSVEVKKVSSTVETLRCDDRVFSNSCLKLIEETLIEENVNTLKGAKVKLSFEKKNNDYFEDDEDYFVGVNVADDKLNNQLNCKIEQFHKSDEIVLSKSPTETPTKLKVKSENPEDEANVDLLKNEHVSPSKSVVSIEDVSSLVSDIDWWDENDFCDQVNLEIEEPTLVEKQTEVIGSSHAMDKLNDVKVVKDTLTTSEPVNSSVEYKMNKNAPEPGRSDIVNISKPIQENRHIFNLEHDPLYYILSSPPAEIAWNTIFLHSVYKDIYNKYNFLPTEEKRLYSRLFSRKYDWIRLDNIKYDFVPDVAMSLTNLAKIGFVKFLDPLTEELSVVLNFMQLDEIKTACEVLKLSKKGKKSDMVDSVLKYLRSQPTLNFGTSTPVNKMKKKVFNIIPKLIKLEDEPRNLFMSFLLISTYPQFKSKDDCRLKIILDIFYRLNTSQLKPLDLPLSACQVFKTLAKFREYEESVNLVENLIELKKNKKWKQATTLILQAKTELTVYLDNEGNITELNETVDYMRKFTSGANYTYAISEGIEVLKKDKTDAGISEAVECLVLLLTQEYFLRGRRSSWYCELAMLMERWNNFDEVFKTLKHGLQEAPDSSVGKFMLTQRCELLIKRKHGLSVPQKNELAILSQIKPYRFSTNTIPAKAMPNVGTNKKQMWTLLTDNGHAYMGVEEVVRQHYMSSEGGGYSEGYHDEGRIIVNLALCVFWTIIYTPLEGMFHVRFQDRPLDWGSSAFYRNRENLIKEYIEYLKTKGIDTIMEEISEVCKKHGTMSMISWELIKLEKLSEIKKYLECIGVESFLKFCDYLFQSYKERSSGLPDLTLWNANTKKCLFVEVKGPSDRLSPKQIVWLQKLNEFGIESEVCHVHTMHTGKRELKNDSEPNLE